MPQIVLTEEQTRILAAAGGSVDVVDSQGRPVASMRLLDAADLEAIQRYKGHRGKRERGIPAEQVQAFLRKLHEVADREGIDEGKVEEMLRRVRGRDQSPRVGI